MRTLRLASLASALLLATPILLAATTTQASGQSTVVADWELNESTNSSVMTDSTGNGHDGAIMQPNSDLLTGQHFDSGTTGYHWTTRCPACLPVALKRVVQVPDTSDGALDIPDPSVPYVLQFRYRTTHPYGNIMQKGQSATPGGQIKVQLPKGKVQCLFKGANGWRVGAGTGTHLYNDGQWHTVQCVHTASYVEVWVDGVRIARKNGSTGPINNSYPFTVGGKPDCDQVKVTCDYYSGDLDWITVSHG